MRENKILYNCIYFIFSDSSYRRGPGSTCTTTRLCIVNITPFLYTRCPTFLVTTGPLTPATCSPCPPTTSSSSSTPRATRSTSNEHSSPSSRPSSTDFADFQSDYADLFRQDLAHFSVKIKQCQITWTQNWLPRCSKCVTKIYANFKRLKKVK